MSLKILIVDDTVVYRHILSEVVKKFPDIDSVETAPNGALALRRMELRPADLVLLDVQMPVMDGLETLKHINTRYPATYVVMVSGCSIELAHITMKALRMGALEFIRKPEGNDREANKQQMYNELKSIITIVKTKTAWHEQKKTPAIIPQPIAPSPTPEKEKVRQRYPIPKSFGIVVIGVSTGGPKALAQLVSGLDASFPIPILVVQHMPPNFTAALAEDLNKKSTLKICEAYENMPITPGSLVIAKGGQHMVARIKDGNRVIGINDEPPENSCKPAVDVLFRSVAHHYSAQGILAIIMTGMGSDGLSGVRMLKRKNCYCITQSAETCVVYGMPRAIDEVGLSDESVELQNIASRISMLVKRKSS